jgi:predicted AAA+ superfamily ATPase
MSPRIVRPLTGYERRVVDDELDELMGSLPAVSLEGPKAVGKTSTARHRANTTYELDAPEGFEIAMARPAHLTEGTPPILIDEWQLLPRSWDLVRRAVDDDRSPGRFLLTGSAAPAGPPTHTGALRIVPIRMRPLALSERGLASTVSLADLITGARPDLSGDTPVTLPDYVNEILTGGFPALRGLPEVALRAQLTGYLDRVIDRDFPEQGLSLRHPDTLRAWMRAYAAATSTTASYEAIRDAATPGVNNKPAKTTTGPWRDVLTRLWLLDPVPAWLPSYNHFKRLGSAEKHHLADPALAASLLGVSAEQLLSGRDVGPAVPRDGTLLGSLFESLVTLSVRVYAQRAGAQVRHLRTHRGEREIDLIVQARDGAVVAIEVKLSATVGDADVKHLKWLAAQIGKDLRDQVVVTTGAHAYRRPDGIAVVPAALLGP